MSYIRANFRKQYGFVRLIYHSNATENYLTASAGGLTAPTGLLCISANACELMIAAGTKFMVFQADGSTA